MDTKIVKSTLLALALCSWAFVGCEPDGYSSEKRIVLTIASLRPADKEPLYQHAGEGAWKPIYIYKKGSADWSIWSAWSPIEGFEAVYEEGYEYQIKVMHRVLEAPPMDANPDEYTLLKVMSKVKKESQGVPTYWVEE